VGFTPLKYEMVIMKKAYSFFFYMLSFAAVAFLMPNFVLYYQGLGFTGMQIGILAGMAPLITMIGAPLWTGLADAKSRHKLIMSLTLLATICLVSIFPLIDALVPVLLLLGLFAIFNAPIPAFADSATMAMLGDEKEMYGRVRLGGTIGYGIAAILTGIIIQSNGIQWAFWGYAAFMFLALCVSQKFTYSKKAENGPSQWDLRWVLANRKWIFFLTLAFAGGMAVTTMNNYLFSYMQELGANRMTMGIALTISTLIEVPVLLFSNLLLRRFKAYGLFVLGIIISAVRLLLYAAFNFTAGILFFQLLNGLTFPIMWVAGVAWADENAPEGMKSTAQGLFGAMVLGIGSAAGGFFGGLMLDSLGGRWMYFVFGSLVLVCVFAVMLLDRAGHERKARSEI
jgi:PPP family 3-phenylpropionic acid transporter